MTEDLHWLNDYQDVLRVLNDNEGEVYSQVKIAEGADRSESSVTSALKTLEKQNLVSREQNGKSKKVLVDEGKPDHWLNDYQDILRALKSAGGEVDKITDLVDKTDRCGGSVSPALEKMEDSGIIEKKTSPQDGRKKRVILKGYEGSEEHELNAYQDILRFLSDGDAKHVLEIEEAVEDGQNSTEERLNYMVENNFLEYDKDGGPSHKKLKIREDETHWLNDYRDILRAVYQSGGAVEPLDSLRFALDDDPYNQIESFLKVLEKHDYLDWDASGLGRVEIPEYSDLTAEGVSVDGQKDQEDYFVANYEVRDYGGDDILWIQFEDEVYVAPASSKHPESGAVKAKKSRSSPVTGVKGAEIIEYAASTDNLRESNA